ncbi:hypothetical protein Ct61P_11515 [Colletotrichum tofieldiae]|nr:hypothetical protein Ct61P_11515 [Colletotrichum tofieldiae]
MAPTSSFILAQLTVESPEIERSENPTGKPLELDCLIISKFLPRSNFYQLQSLLLRCFALDTNAL